MASEPEIHRVRKDKVLWRALVVRLLRYEKGLEPKDFGFLEGLEARHWLEELSYRQAEWLLDIRDNVQTISEYRGYSIKRLIQCCYQNRLDLDEEEEAWVVRLCQSGRTAIRKNEARRLHSLASRLGEVEDWAA